MANEDVSFTPAAPEPYDSNESFTDPHGTHEGIIAVEPSSSTVIEAVPDTATAETVAAVEPAEEAVAVIIEELGPCYWLGLCCPPADAAAALGAHLEASIPTSDGDIPASEETYTSIAGRILAEFRLVPKELTPTLAFQHGSMANAATHRLTKLNEHVRKELLEILPGLGYKVSHE